MGVASAVRMIMVMLVTETMIVVGTLVTGGVRVVRVVVV